MFGFAGIAGALTKYDQLSGPLLAGLLLFPTLGMAAAPVNSWAARRAALPECSEPRVPPRSSVVNPGVHHAQGLALLAWPPMAAGFSGGGQSGPAGQDATRTGLSECGFRPWATNRSILVAPGNSTRAEISSA